MGIKKALVKYAGKKVASKILMTETVDNAITSTINKMEQYGQNNTIEKYDYYKGKRKNYVVIKVKAYSLGKLVGTYLGGKTDYDEWNKKYHVYDDVGELIYKADSILTFTDRYILDVFDTTGVKIGCIKQWIVPIGVPLLEKELQRCTISLGSGKSFDLKKFKLMGELEFEVVDKDIEIKCDRDKNIDIYLNGEVIVELYRLPHEFSNSYVDKYIMAYDKMEYEMLGILLAIGIDIITE